MLAYNFAFGLFVKVSATMAATPTKLHVKRKFCSALTKFAAEFAMAAFGQPSIEMLLKLNLRITDWLCKCVRITNVILVVFGRDKMYSCPVRHAFRWSCAHVTCGMMFRMCCKTFTKEENQWFSWKLLLVPAYKEGCLRDYSCFRYSLAKRFYSISHAQPQP